MKRRNKTKIAVALSGGLDSAFSAYLLKKEGFMISGVYIKLWKEKEEKIDEGEEKAKEIANYLNIPLYIFGLRKEFKKIVVDYFLEEFEKGRTPNPCVICNKKIKFGLLLKKVLSLKFDYLATGHYLRKIKVGKTYKILRGKDRKKDQSYFLWQLDQKQLKYSLFPLGDFKKERIRKKAKKINLPFKKKESKEICFVKKTINDFLIKEFGKKPGKIIDDSGKFLGKHQGLFLYTLGQRKGLNLPGGPYYVLEKKLKENILIVTKNEEKLFKKNLLVEKVNFISGKEIKNKKIKVQIRYQQNPFTAKLKKINQKNYLLEFQRKQKVITPGQSAVFYSLNNKELLGGGVIV